MFMLEETYSSSWKMFASRVSLASLFALLHQVITTSTMNNGVLLDDRQLQGDFAWGVSPKKGFPVVVFDIDSSSLGEVQFR